MNIKNMIFSFNKSFLNFIHLLKNRKFEKIYQISQYYFMDQVLRRLFIAVTIADGKLRPPKHLHTCPSCKRAFLIFILLPQEAILFSILNVLIVKAMNAIGHNGFITAEKLIYFIQGIL